MGVGRFGNIITATQQIVDQSDWFEEVEQIYVRPENAERLKEIDALADDQIDIGQPFMCEPGLAYVLGGPTHGLGCR